MSELEMWRRAIIVIAATGQTLFVLLYVTFPWYRTFLGKALFIKATTFMLLLNTAAAGFIWNWPHEEIWMVTLYGLTTFGIWAQFTAFFVQRFGNGDQDSTQLRRDYHHGTNNQGEPDGPLQGIDPRARVTD